MSAAQERKKSVEKVKAAQMSRHLMTRLSYARLKVDHGWHKQNLNEVENLYFHHYRQPLKPRSTSPLAEPLAASFDQPILEPPLILPEVDAVMEEADQPHTPRSLPKDNGTPVDEDSQPVDISIQSPEAATTEPATPTLPPLTGEATISSPTLTQKKPPASPKSPVARASTSPTLPKTPIRSPASNNIPNSASMNFTPLGSRQPGSMPTPNSNASPAGMTYDSFWSSLSTATQPSYKSSLANAAQVTGLNIGIKGGGMGTVGAAREDGR